jgi:dihydroneopterin aldolase
MPAKHKFSHDKIFIEGLLLKCLCGPDAFGRIKPHPVDLSVTLGTMIARAAVDDCVDLSVDYSDLVKQLGKLEEETYSGTVELLDRVVKLGLENEKVGSINVIARLEKGLLCAREVVWEQEAYLEDAVIRSLKCHVRGIQVFIIIGIKENEHERTQKQPVEVDLTWIGDSSDISSFNPKDLVNSLIPVLPTPPIPNLENRRLRL